MRLSRCWGRWIVNKHSWFERLGNSEDDDEGEEEEEWGRSRRSRTQTALATREIKLRIRQVHATPDTSMRCPASRLYARPPKPAPEVAMPTARLRWEENQGGRSAMACGDKECE